MILGKYSIGIGDRFGRQGKAQLGAMAEAKALGVDVTPVWNKSHREHTLIGTSPPDVRKEADQAVRDLGWAGPYFVDADHIGMKNVDLFLESSDFFTIDVADFTGQSASEEAIRSFVSSHKGRAGDWVIPGLSDPLRVTEDLIATIARKYLLACQEAGRIYRHIASKKRDFVVEVSMDETDVPQGPMDLFFILAALSQESIPVQTIAPKFTGRFNKGVDYVGDVAQFAKEFEQDLAVIALAVKTFGLPRDLKLSVHSGSDKFSIYGAMRQAIRRFDAGLHLKTAGTTWLEEVIGLAMAGGEGLVIAKEIYGESLGRYDELCGPYAKVLDIDKNRLPAPSDVHRWSAEAFVAALRHDPTCPSFNLHFRQLIHVGYKIAAEMGERYLKALDTFRDVVGRNVAENLLDRHIRRVFV